MHVIKVTTNFYDYQAKIIMFSAQSYIYIAISLPCHNESGHKRLRVILDSFG